MRRTITMLTAAAVLVALATPAAARDDAETGYRDAIWRTTDMVWDEGVIELAARHGLEVLNVAWEDTGRYHDSSVGPNISDVTIQVQYEDPHTKEATLALMPVIRYPNFVDLTADLDIDDFYLPVGNERGGELDAVSLRQYLGDLRRYLTDPDSWKGRRGSLLSDRDDHVLVSAQAAFLPVPFAGEAQFNPVIFNYQSYQGDPAVLTIVATREGTSATIIDNVRDGFDAGPTWGQRLFFNQSGERASFTGTRLSDFAADERDPANGGDATPVAATSTGLNMVLIIQVPLRQKNPMVFGDVLLEAEDGLAYSAPPPAESNVEAAVIGHGEVEGPFTEIDGLDIERDERFPVRVTVQFYKATTNGVVSAEDMEQIAAEIERVYDDGEFVGSLVVDGDIGRPTEHDGPWLQPADWWRAFWERHEANTNMTRAETLDLLERLGAVARRTMAWLR